jgi:hypothetical protein
MTGKTGESGDDADDADDGDDGDDADDADMVGRDDNKDRECSICLDGNGDTKTKCSHWFHKKCLSEWKKEGDHYTCPNCRYDLVEVEIVTVVEDAKGREIFIPMMFSFNTNVGLAIPFAAFSYLERYIDITFDESVLGIKPNHIDRNMIIPFALHPNNYQPSGHVNISRIKEIYVNCYKSYKYDANKPDDKALVKYGD